MKLITFKCYISSSTKSISTFKMCKRPLDSTSNFTFLFIVFLLFARQWPIAMRFFYDSIINAISSTFSFYIRTIIGLIRKYRSFISTNKIFKFFRIMYIGRCVSNFTYNAGAFIYSYMAFIAIISLFSFLGKAGIIILLGILFFFFFAGDFFLLLFLFLLWFSCRLNNGCINYRPTLENKIAFIQHF